jgi:hypothetical protein
VLDDHSIFLRIEHASILEHLTWCFQRLIGASLRDLPDVYVAREAWVALWNSPGA